MAPVLILVGFLSLGIAGIVALVRWQTRSTRTESAKPSEVVWKESGFDSLGRDRFELWRVSPTEKMTVAEFVFTNEAGAEVGRYASEGRKSGHLSYDGKQADLYIQGSGLNKTVYSGEVGGTTDSSIVIRDSQHVIAEVWRENVALPLRYRMAYAGRTYSIEQPGLMPTRPATVQCENETAAMYRCTNTVARTIALALRRDLPHDLKACLCAIALLQ